MFLSLHFRTSLRRVEMQTRAPALYAYVFGAVNSVLLAGTEKSKDKIS